MSEPFFKENQGNVVFVDNVAWIKVRDANTQLRERGAVVYGWNSNERPDCWGPQSRDDTHRALLINIEPIERDSVEKIVEDLMALENHRGTNLLERLIDRARKLKEKS